MWLRCKNVYKEEIQNYAHKKMSHCVLSKGSTQASIMLYVWLLTLMLKIQCLQRHDIWQRQKSQQRPEQREDLGHDNATQCRSHSWIWQLWWWQRWRCKRVCVMHAYVSYCMCLLVCLCNLTQKWCMSEHICFLTDVYPLLYHAWCRGMYVPICMCGLPLGLKSQSTSLSGEQDTHSAQGSMPFTPGTLA